MIRIFENTDPTEIWLDTKFLLNGHLLIIISLMNLATISVPGYIWRYGHVQHAKKLFYKCDQNHRNSED